ncbi:MAG: hypothetical protein QGG83_02525 [Candidatus Woesearchaeota archaeon]|nr:hypothetical protein [Candidatus Woesearchaeota archaeon]
MRWQIPALCLTMAVGGLGYWHHKSKPAIVRPSYPSVTSFKSEHGSIVHAWGQDPFVVIGAFVHSSSHRITQLPIPILERLGPIADQLYDVHGLRIMIPERLNAKGAELIERRRGTMGAEGPDVKSTKTFITCYENVLTRRKWDLVGARLETSDMREQLKTLYDSCVAEIRALPLDGTTEEQTAEISKAINSANSRIRGLLASKEGQTYINRVLDGQEQAYVDAAAPYIARGEPVYVLPGNGHPIGIAQKCKKAGLSYVMLQPKGLDYTWVDDRVEDFITSKLIDNRSLQSTEVKSHQ